MMNQLIDIDAHELSLSNTDSPLFDRIGGSSPIISEVEVEATTTATTAAAAAVSTAAPAAAAAASVVVVVQPMIDSSEATKDRTTSSVITSATTSLPTITIAMLNTKRCAAPGCETRPTYGTPGGEQTFCTQHKRRDMVDVCSKTCQEEM